MDKLANSWSKNYVNSPQFSDGSYMRETDVEMEPMRKIKDEYIPAERFNEINIKPYLKNLDEKIRKQIETFHEKFTYTNPIVIYNSIAQDSRGELPINNVLMKDINIFYNDNFDINLYNLYKNSAKFFADVFLTLETGKYDVNQAKFNAYEKYIYLISILVYVFDNKDALNGKLDKDYNAVINWMQIRYSDSLKNILRGPQTTYNTPSNFEEHYKALISSASTIENIYEESKISKLNLTYNELANFKFAFKNTPNTFHKNYDNARQYNIIVYDSTKLAAKIDDDNNLIFDGSYLDIGDVGNQQIIAQYNSIIVQQNIEQTPPTRTLPQQLQLLFNQYSAIKVSELSFRYDMFLVDLSKFDLIYLVFPDIITIERTIYNENGPGVLRIAGKFIKNNELLRYEFIPNEECVSFIGSQTFVKSFRFYITNNSKNDFNDLTPNKLVINFSKNQVFQHLLGTNLINTSEIIDIAVNPNNIEYNISNNINNISNPFSVSNFIRNLQYVPDDLRNYFINDFVNDYNKYNQNQKIINSNSNNISNNVLTNITENTDILNKITTYIKYIMNLNNEINKQTPIRINDIENMKTDMLNLMATNFTTTSIDLVNDMNYNNYQSIINTLFNLKLSDVLSSYNTYEDLNSLLNLANIVKSYLSLNNSITLKFNTKLGTVNNYGFKLQNNKLIITDEINDENIYLDDKDNKNIIIRFFDSNELNLIPTSNYLYNPYSHIVQLLPFTIDDVYKIRNINYNYGINIYRKSKSNTNDLDIGTKIDVLNSIFTANDIESNIYYGTLFDSIFGYTCFGYNYNTSLLPSLSINAVGILPKYLVGNSNINLLEINTYENDGENNNILTTLTLTGNGKLIFYGNKANELNDNTTTALNSNPGVFINDVIISKLSNNYTITVGKLIRDDTYNKLIIRVSITYDQEHDTIIDFPLNLSNQIIGFFIKNDSYISINNSATELTRGENQVPSNEYFNDFITNSIMGGYIYNNTYTYFDTNGFIHEYKTLGNIDDMINNYSLYLPDSNIFKTYIVSDVLYNDYFNRYSYITGIMINPLPLPAFKNELINNEIITETKNGTTYIYTFDKNRPYISTEIINKENVNKPIQKTFYNNVLINQSLPGVIYVDGNETDKEVFIYKAINDVIVNTNTNNLSNVVQLSNNVSVSFIIENNVIQTTTINYKTDTFTLNGNLVDGKNYILFNDNRLILFSINTKIINDVLYSENITFTTIYSELYSYVWINNQLYKNYYYHTIANEVILLMNNIDSNINPVSLYYVLDDIKNPTIPVIKYYQDNINSDNYIDENGKVQMVLNTGNKVNNNQTVVLRKNEVPMDDLFTAENVELANNIPINDTYIAETVNNRIVINNIDNADKNIDNIVINSNSGIALLTENNNLHLSINFK